MNGHKTIDLLALAKVAGQEEAAARAQQARNESIQLVCFTPNRDPGHDLPVGRHPVTNRAVFPDMRRDGATIKAGHAYFCDLVEYHPTTGPPVYYANPIRRVDPSFLFDLHPNQVDQVIAAVVRNSQDQLLQQARARIQSEVEDTTRSQLSTMRTELDSLRAENTTLRGKLSKSAEASGLPTALPRIDTSAPISCTVPAVDRQSTYAVGIVQSTTMVSRPSPEELSSPLIVDSRYFAHVSPDRKKLLIHSHPGGNLPAVHSSLKVPGLAVLRPFDGIESLHALVDPRGGGLIIDLLREP